MSFVQTLFDRSVLFVQSPWNDATLAVGFAFLAVFWYVNRHRVVTFNTIARRRPSRYRPYVG